MSRIGVRSTTTDQTNKKKPRVLARAGGYGVNSFRYSRCPSKSKASIKTCATGQLCSTCADELVDKKAYIYTHTNTKT